MPPPPAGGQSDYSPVEAISYGWRKFTQNVGPLLGVTAIMLIIGVTINFGVSLATSGSVLGTSGLEPDGTLPDNYLIAQLGNLVGSFVIGIISWALGLALMRGSLDVVDTGRTDFSAMFTRIPWGQALLAGLLVYIATFVGTILCIIPGIIVGFLFYYSSVAVLDGNDAIDAIKASYNFTTGHLSETILLFLLAIVLIIVGICTCGIGLFIVTPVLSIAVAYTWRVLQGRPVAP